MATCRECIHFNDCLSYGKTRYYGENIACNDVQERCRYFKNKADYAEVKHGYWIDDIQKITTVAGVERNGIVGYKCSLCGRREGSKEPYCNCGAIMDVPDTNDGKKGETYEKSKM